VKCQHTKRDIEIAQEHLQTLIIKLSAALAVWHEGTPDDALHDLLQDANLEAWRMRWQLNSPSGPEETAVAP
jgi:DNA-directed RNA polymerase specialized sigma24 family protein